MNLYDLVEGIKHDIMDYLTNERAKLEEQVKAGVKITQTFGGYDVLIAGHRNPSPRSRAASEEILAQDLDEDSLAGAQGSERPLGEENFATEGDGMPGPGPASEPAGALNQDDVLLPGGVRV